MLSKSAEYIETTFPESKVHPWMGTHDTLQVHKQIEMHGPQGQLHSFGLEGIGASGGKP